MKNPLALIGVRTRVVILGALLVLGWIYARQVAAMDERFFADRAGLAFYLVGDYSRAARAYRAHLREAVGQARGRVDPAWGEFVEGNFPAARALAEVQLGGLGRGEARLTLAETALAEGDARRAVTVLAPLLARDRDNFDARMLDAVAHARLREHDRAIYSMNRALRHPRAEQRPSVFLTVLEAAGDLGALPRSERPSSLLAHLHRYLRIYDASNGAVVTRYADAAIKAGDRPDEAYLAVGVVYAKQGRSESALQSFLSGIKLNPRNPFLLHWATVSYSQRGDLLKELGMLRAAFDAAPDDVHYGNALHRVLTRKLGDYQQALTIYQDALRRRPDDPAVWNHLGVVHGEMGDRRRALDAHERAVALASDEPEHVVQLGWALLATARKHDALAAFSRAVELLPSSGGAHYGLAAAYQEVGRHPEAIAAYERSFSVDGPDSADRLLPLCGLYSRVSAFERAEHCLKLALRMDPNNFVALRAMKDVEYNLKSQRAKK